MDTQTDRTPADAPYSTFRILGAAIAVAGLLMIAGAFLTWGTVHGDDVQVSSIASGHVTEKVSGSIPGIGRGTLDVTVTNLTGSDGVNVPGIQQTQNLTLDSHNYGVAAIVAGLLAVLIGGVIASGKTSRFAPVAARFAMTVGAAQTVWLLVRLLDIKDPVKNTGSGGISGLQVSIGAGLWVSIAMAATVFVCGALAFRISRRGDADASTSMSSASTALPYPTAPVGGYRPPAYAKADPGAGPVIFHTDVH